MHRGFIIIFSLRFVRYINNGRKTQKGKIIFAGYAQLQKLLSSIDSIQKVSVRLSFWEKKRKSSLRMQKKNWEQQAKTQIMDKSSTFFF